MATENAVYKLTDSALNSNQPKNACGVYSVIKESFQVL
jgi:hypothetical protein